MEKVVWAGTHQTSFGAAAESLAVLAEQSLSAKQVRRITTYIGADRVAERREQVAEFTSKTLMERTAAKPVRMASARVRLAAAKAAMATGGVIIDIMPK